MELFSKEKDYTAFEGLLEQTLESRPMRICAYCLMPNHWHFVLWPAQDGDVGRLHAATHHQARGAIGSCTAGEWALGMSTKGGTSRFRLRKKTISIGLCVMWSATRCGRAWSSKPRRGDGPAFGDDPRARRSKSNCSVFGRWHIRRAGASSSMNHKRRRRWRRFVVAWPAASPTEGRIGSTGRPSNSGWNRLFEYRTGHERLPGPNDPPK